MPSSTLQKPTQEIHSGACSKPEWVPPCDWPHDDSEERYELNRYETLIPNMSYYKNLPDINQKLFYFSTPKTTEFGDDRNFTGPMLCVSEGAENKHFLRLNQINEIIQLLQQEKSEILQQQEKSDDFEKIVLAIKRGPKPTTGQIILIVLCALTGVGLIVGLIQLAITAKIAHYENTNWRKYLKYTGEVAACQFLLCKLPPPPICKNVVFDT